MEVWSLIMQKNLMIPKFDGLKVISNESNSFDDPKEFDDPLVFNDPKRVSIGTMDFLF